MKTITLTDEQYSALMQGESVTIEPKLEKWQPKGGEWFVNARGSVEYMPTEKDTREFGVEYQTEQQAVNAASTMRKHNRLLAWLTENDDGWVADWLHYHQKKSYVLYDNTTSNWRVFYNDSFKALGTVYMSESNAKKLCKLLNDGVVVL